MSNIVVLDIEAHAVHRVPELNLPDCSRVRSQRNGLHFYFSYSGEHTTTWIENGEHLGDLKSDGSYVLAPPTVGEHGIYTWEREVELTEIPDSLLEKFYPPLHPVCTRTLSNEDRSRRIVQLAWPMVLQEKSVEEIIKALMEDRLGGDRLLQYSEDARRRYVQRYVVDYIKRSIVKKEETHLVEVFGIRRSDDAIHVKLLFVDGSCLGQKTISGRIALSAKELMVHFEKALPVLRIGARCRVVIEKKQIGLNVKRWLHEHS